MSSSTPHTYAIGLVVLVSTLSTIAGADVRLPAVLSEHLVLQRDDLVPLWGWAEPGEVVTVTAGWSGAVVTAAADEDGEWRVELETGAAGGPWSLVFVGANRIELGDVLLGEVWVCSGQSNMEWTIDQLAPTYDSLKPGASDPELRVFDVERNLATSEQADCGGTWRAITPDHLGDVTAVGYFFGSALRRELGVPVGLLSTNWGGTRAEAWTSDETLRDWPDFAERRAVVRAEATRPGAAADGRRAALAGWWRELESLDPGSRDGWKRPDLDDSSWRTLTVPSDWRGTDLEGFDGVVWMRREVEVPASWSGRKLLLDLGPIDDQDTTWFNGARVGGMEDEGLWTKLRHYEVPAELVREGGNVITVRVLDTGGEGGLTGGGDAPRLAAGGEASALSLAGEWHYREGIARAELPPWPSLRGLDQHYPSVLFNGMIAPLLSFAMRGVIWYQGESNRERAYQYRTLFPALIADWRARWGRGEFPFYYVQIAPFAYGGDRGEAAELREAQLLALSVPNTGMVSTMDIGDPGNIHPREKREVGERLARWALARTYGEDARECCGPIWRGLSLEGRAIRLTFDHAGGGLTSGGEALTCFTISGADRVFHPARAVIDGETVVVSAEEVPEPVAVRFAWGAADESNLRNAAGLPASSFRTDAWPGKTLPR